MSTNREYRQALEAAARKLGGTKPRVYHTDGGPRPSFAADFGGRTVAMVIPVSSCSAVGVRNSVARYRRMVKEAGKQ